MSSPVSRSALLVSFTSLMLGSCSFGARDELIVNSEAHEINGVVYSLVYGVRRFEKAERLEFIAVVGSTHGEAKSMVDSGGTTETNRWVNVERPDGTTVAFASTFRRPKSGVEAFESIDGEWRESLVEVSLEEFDSFKRTANDGLRISDLERFLEQKRDASQ